MSPAQDLVFDVVAIRRHAGTRRDMVVTAVINEAMVGEVSIAGPTVDVDLVVETIRQGIAVSGSVGAHWSGPCRRCLTPVEGDLHAEIREIFEDEPTEGETWPITDERIDLAPPVHEAVMLAIPMAPLCSEDCRGPEPERFPTGTPNDDEAPATDPRWAGLADLDFDET